MRGALVALAVAACAVSASPAEAQLFDNGSGSCTGLCRLFSGGAADDGEPSPPPSGGGHRLRRHPSRSALRRQDRETADQVRSVPAEPRRHRRPAEVRRASTPVVATARPIGTGSPKRVAPFAAPPAPAARIEPASLTAPAVARPAAAPDGITAAPLE